MSTPVAFCDAVIYDINNVTNNYNYEWIWLRGDLQSKEFGQRRGIEYN